MRLPLALVPVLAFALSAMGQGTNPVQPFPQAKGVLTATNVASGSSISVTNITPTITFTVTAPGFTNTQTLSATNVAVPFTGTTNGVTVQNLRVKATAAGNSSSMILPVTVGMAPTNGNLYALVTDGTQNYAQTDPSQVFAPLTGNLRVSFWTYCDTLPSGQFAFMGTLTGGEGWTIQMTPSFEVYFDVFAQGSGDQYSPFVAAGMTTGVWTHISAAYSIDTGGVACWVNGVWTGPPTVGLTLFPTNSANFSIGARTALDTWFPGLIRDIRIESWDGSTNNFTPAWVQGSVGATAYFPMSSTNAAYVPESVGSVNANFFGIPIPAWTNAPTSFP